MLCRQTATELAERIFAASEQMKSHIFFFYEFMCLYHIIEFIVTAHRISGFMRIHINYMRAKESNVT